MDFAKKLIRLREDKGLSQYEVATRLGIKRPRYNAWEQGISKPRTDMVNVIADFFEVSPNYLLGHEASNQQLNHSFEHTFNNSSVEMVQIPIYGEIRAGYGALAQENIIGYEIVSKDSISDGEYFYLYVKGDSMIDEGIQEGMRVLVRKQNTCQQGKIGVVLVDGDEGTLKRVFYEDDNIILQASNRNIPPKVYPIYDVIIQGQVTKVEFDV